MKKTHKTTIILLVVILFVSISLNYFFYNLGRGQYIQLNWIRLDPLGLKSFPTENYQPEEDGKIRVVFYGDSRAARWPSHEHEDFDFINRGIGGQTSAQVLLRFDQHIQPLHPKIIIVQVGINDLKTIPLFPDQKDEIISDLQTNILKIVQKSVDQNSTIILSTIFPVRKVSIDQRLFWSDEVGSAIEEVNAFIFSLENENVIIFDAYSLLVGENKLILPEYSDDFLHVNATGYEVLNEELDQVMINLISRN